MMSDDKKDGDSSGNNATSGDSQESSSPSGVPKLEESGSKNDLPSNPHRTLSTFAEDIAKQLKDISVPLSLADTYLKALTASGLGKSSLLAAAESISNEHREIIDSQMLGASQKHMARILEQREALSNSVLDSLPKSASLFDSLPEGLNLPSAITDPQILGASQKYMAQILEQNETLAQSLVGSLTATAELSTIGTSAAGLIPDGVKGFGSEYGDALAATNFAETVSNQLTDFGFSETLKKTIDQSELMSQGVSAIFREALVQPPSSIVTLLEEQKSLFDTLRVSIDELLKAAGGIWDVSPFSSTITESQLTQIVDSTFTDPLLQPLIEEAINYGEVDFELPDDAIDLLGSKLEDQGIEPSKQNIQLVWSQILHSGKMLLKILEYLVLFITLLVFIGVLPPSILPEPLISPWTGQDQTQQITRKAEKKYLYVVKSAPLRLEPDRAGGKIARLQPNQRIELLEKHGNWFYVSIKDKNGNESMGWVSRGNVRLSKSTTIQNK